MTRLKYIPPIKFPPTTNEELEAALKAVYEKGFRDGMAKMAIALSPDPTPIAAPKGRKKA